VHDPAAHGDLALDSRTEVHPLSEGKQAVCGTAVGIGTVRRYALNIARRLALH